MLNGLEADTTYSIEARQAYRDGLTRLPRESRASLTQLRNFANTAAFAVTADVNMLAACIIPRKSSWQVHIVLRRHG